MKSEAPIFYLFASATGDSNEIPGAVFCKVKGESLAKSLCALFKKEYAGPTGFPVFRHKAATSIPAEEQVLSNESLDWLAIYDDPDRGVYDPPPSKELHLLAQYAARADKWEELLGRQGISGNDAGVDEASGPASQDSPTMDRLWAMPDEDRRNSGFLLLLLLAQAYYKMLECSVSTASWFTTLDLNLNQSYFWTVKSITNLLKNHEDLKDFPIQFEPVFPDLYPATIGDSDWDMVAQEVEGFLSAVQQYVVSRGAYEPEKGSPGWIFIELFRPSVNSAIEHAIAYDKRIRHELQRKFGTASQVAAVATPEPSTAKKNEETKDTIPVATRDKVFLSYSHKDKKFLTELLAHLKPLQRSGRVSAWSDKQIQAGSQWLDEIRSALASAKVAVLLVTKDFLASDFIHDQELGPLLKEAAKGGVAIRWVLVRDCNWKKTPLKDFQAAYLTAKPLAEMKAERDSAWVAICDSIEAAANSQ